MSAIVAAGHGGGTWRRGLARRRRELRVVRFFLERCTGNEGLRQILRILDDGRDREPLGPEIGVTVVILRYDRGLAVGHAVRSQVSRPHVRRHDFQLARTLLRRTAKAKTAS